MGTSAWWTVGFVVLTLASPAWGGWLIEEVTRGAGAEGRQQLVLQGNRLKTVMVAADVQPQQAFIVDLDAQTVTHVDYAERRYVAANVEEYAREIGRAAQAAMGQAAEALKQMEEAMKGLPPEQRQMMEAMMKGRGMPARSSSACVEPRRQVRRTGQQATVAGYRAERVELLADGKLEAELWLAPELRAWRELDPAKLERFTAAMARALPGCAGPDRPGLLGADPAWRLAGEGFPVRAVAHGVTVEVVRAESRPIPVSEFQPPAGFARAALGDLLGR